MMQQRRNRHIPRLMRVLAGVLALYGGAARAAENDKAPTRVRAVPFEAVLACRKVADIPARVACYDQTTGDMEAAEARGDIVVIGRTQAASASREAFGLHVPTLGMLTRALGPGEADRYDGVVRSVRADASGQWTLSLEDGAVWRQIDGFLTRPPRAGSKVSIRKGALGSFLLNLDGQKAVKVHRVE